MSKIPESYADWELNFKGSKKFLSKSTKDPQINSLGFTPEEFKNYLQDFKQKILYPAMKKKNEENENDNE